MALPSSWKRPSQLPLFPGGRAGPRARLAAYVRGRLTTHLIWLIIVVNAAYLLLAAAQFMLLDWVNYPPAYGAIYETGSGYGFALLLWCAFAVLVFFLHRRALASGGRGRPTAAYWAVGGAILVYFTDAALEAWKSSAAGGDWPSLFYVAAIVALYLLMWYLPQSQLAPWKEKLEAKDYLTIANGNRTFLLQFVGGTVLLAGLYYTAQNMSIAQENVRLTLLKQESERLNQAVAQLKDESLEARLVAIYNLRSIATASSDNYYLITGILEKYVSRRAAWKVSETPSTPPAAEPLPDIQAVLAFISDPFTMREVARKESIRNGVRIVVRPLVPRNFSGLDLRGLALNYGVMSRWSLSGSHLEGADLSFGQLDVANLDGADLSSADLSNASLRGASLRNAIFNATNLSEASLEGADLEGADLSNAVGLTTAMVRSTENYDKAKLPPAIQAELAGGAP